MPANESETSMLRDEAAHVLTKIGAIRRAWTAQGASGSRIAGRHRVEMECARSNRQAADDAGFRLP